jgi:hypothetical protein
VWGRRREPLTATGAMACKDSPRGPESALDAISVGIGGAKTPVDGVFPACFRAAMRDMEQRKTRSGNRFEAHNTLGSNIWCPG